MARKRVVEDVDETVAEETVAEEEGSEDVTEEAAVAEAAAAGDTVIWGTSLTREVLDPNKVVKLDGGGSYAVVEYDNTLRDRRILYHGTNYEHVHDDADGVWCYRQM